MKKVFQRLVLFSKSTPGRKGLGGEYKVTQPGSEQLDCLKNLS